jgi:hypothetical protein
MKQNRVTFKQLKMAIDLAFDNTLLYNNETCYEMGMGMGRNQNHFSMQNQRIFASNLIMNAIIYGVSDGISDGLQ